MGSVRRWIFIEMAGDRSMRLCFLHGMYLVTYHREARYHCTDQEFPYLPCFSAKFLSIKGGGDLVITWHEVWGDYWNEYLGSMGFAGAAVERLAIRLAGTNIAVSERTRADLDMLGLREVKVVPNGIDFGRISGITPSVCESDVVYAGRLVSHKNIDLLIRAIALVKREAPDVRVLVIGEGPEGQSLMDLAKSLGLEKNVEFAGFLDYDAMISRLKASRAFVLPSTREGFGIAALERTPADFPSSP